MHFGTLLLVKVLADRSNNMSNSAEEMCSIYLTNVLDKYLDRSKKEIPTFRF